MLNKNEMNRFDEIEHTPLRVYNRVVMCFNILEDLGKAALEEYLKIFSEGEKKQMYIMQGLIKSKGPDEVRRMALEGMEFVDDEGYRD